MLKKKEKLSILAAALLMIFAVAPVSNAMHVMEGFLPVSHCILWIVICIPFLVIGVLNIKKLLENEEDHIKMFCKLTWLLYDTKYKTYKEDFTVEEYYVYKIKGLYFEGCLEIVEISYKEGQQEYASESHYCVTPSDGYATKE